MQILRAAPSGERVVRFLQAQSQLGFSYPQASATRGFERGGAAPAGYIVDHQRALLGRGPEAFAAACQALEHWQMFAIPWVRLYWPSVALTPGAAVGVAVRFYGLWLLNACRIVYVIRDADRLGFAYGTLPGHGARGEERFLVQVDAEGQVWYDLLAYSQPAHPLARLGRRLMRRLQTDFGPASAAAMQQAVKAAQK